MHQRCSFRRWSLTWQHVNTRTIISATHRCITVNSHRIKVSVLARHDFLRQRSVPDGFCLAFPPRKERNRVMKTIILNIFSRILKLCRCVFLLDVYLFYVLMCVLQEIFPPWPIPFKVTGKGGTDSGLFFACMLISFTVKGEKGLGLFS